MDTNIIKSNNGALSLRISGTKMRQAGFAHLISIGVLPNGEGDHLDRVTLIPDRPAYVLKHHKDYILYKLIDQNVRSYDATTPGILTIAIAIPSTHRLKGNKSPYTLLREVYDTFVAENMESVENEMHRFKNTDYDSERFRAILSQYPLEPSTRKYVEMTPTGMAGMLRIDTGRLEAFFRDTQYDEFASFGCIEVGSQHTETTERLKHIKIPRSISYKLIINGKKSNRQYEDPNEVIDANDSSSDRFSEYLPVSFTIAEVENSGGTLNKSGAEIKLIPETEEIRCSLGKKDIIYKIKTAWSKETSPELRSQINKLLKEGKLSIHLGNTDLSLPIGTDQYKDVIAKDALTSVKISSRSNLGFDLRAQKVEGQEEKTIIIQIGAMKKQATVKTATKTYTLRMNWEDSTEGLQDEIETRLKRHELRLMLGSTNISSQVYNQDKTLDNITAQVTLESKNRKGNYSQTNQYSVSTKRHEDKGELEVLIEKNRKRINPKQIAIISLSIIILGGIVFFFSKPGKNMINNMFGSDHKEEITNLQKEINDKYNSLKDTNATVTDSIGAYKDTLTVNQKKITEQRDSLTKVLGDVGVQIKRIDSLSSILNGTVDKIDSIKGAIRENVTLDNLKKTDSTLDSLVQQYNREKADLMRLIDKPDSTAQQSPKGSDKGKDSADSDKKTKEDGKKAQIEALKKQVLDIVNGKGTRDDKLKIIRKIKGWYNINESERLNVENLLMKYTKNNTLSLNLRYDTFLEQNQIKDWNDLQKAVDKAKEIK